MLKTWPDDPLDQGWACISVTVSSMHLAICRADENLLMVAIVVILILVHFVP